MRGGCAVIGLAVLAGVGLAAGGCLLVSGLRPSTAVAPGRSAVESWSERAAAVMSTIDKRRFAVSLGAGALAWFVTRWPLAAVGGAVAGWWVPLPGQRSAEQDAQARTAALALWCESLRDAAATARGIEGILTATAGSAPQAIQPEVSRMARRLENEPLDVVLDGLAADLYHPIGDLVVTALRLASSAGSRRVRQVLRDLATAAELEASMYRRVEVARQRPRSTMRLVAVIVACFIGGLMLFAQDYLAPYDTATGQLVLVAVAGYWALGFWWMARLGRVSQVQRFIARAGKSRP
jgi:tight adherence protein B